MPWAAYLFYKEAGDDEWGEVLTPEAMVGLAEKWVERWGFKCIKVKGGVLEPDEEVETMRLLRERFGPSMQLRIDPNAIWSVETSRRVAYKLQRRRPGVPRRPDVGHHRHGRGREGDPHAAQHQHVRHVVRPHPRGVPLRRDPRDPGRPPRLGGPDRLRPDGPDLCHALGWGVGQHSNSHLGITMAAMTHLAAAVPNLIYASDTHYPWNPDDIIKGPMFEIKDGYLDVPTGPGPWRGA